ncbi:MAG: hypothetical protein BWY87_00669 [Deltaproteobacteria bacterium ADurb.Bin510]|nr:MAG: hypothetical protein BWY87_00669 [Deltaproteobacteria bacterium ADurb.Bin510]
MPKSMTGFGQADVGSFHIEIKGVNHRYKEIRVKLPRELSAFEIEVRNIVQNSIGRGKVDVTISRNPGQDTGASLEINWPLASQSHAVLKTMSAQFGGEPCFRDLLAIPGVMIENRQDAEELWLAVKPGLEQALNAFEQSKQAEGETLKLDLDQRIATLNAFQAEMAARAATMPGECRERLMTRIEALLGENNLDRGRLEQEVALLVDRCDITEELVRLKTHLEAFAKTLKVTSEPIGRRLDFILQEINRELNTVGSKTQLIEISHLVINGKTEVEKIREQAQNIE